MTIHRRNGLPLLVAIVLAAAMVTGCGGGGDESPPAASAAGANPAPTTIATAPTLESAAAAFAGLREKYNSRIAAINARVDAAQKANEPGSVAIALDDWAQIVDESRTDFDAIDFPSQSQAAAEEFARALAREAAASRRLSKDIYDRDARDEFVASLAARDVAGKILRRQLGMAG